MIEPQLVGNRFLVAAALLYLALAVAIPADRTSAGEATRSGEAKPATRAKPRAKMVQVPAGPFYYGCLDPVDVACDPDERPPGKLTLSAFAIDRTEVTVAAYRRCVEAKACSAKDLGADAACNWGKSGREQHPINCVELDHARKYCEWAGKRVPREQEWEKAARGIDGRMFSWGNLPIADAGLVANIADRSADFDWKLASYDDGFAETAPVGSFPDGASPYGALDMIGNVWEWTQNSYTHQRGHAVRGCSWRSHPTVCRTSNRLWRQPGQTKAYFGFRCAR